MTKLRTRPRTRPATGTAGDPQVRRRARNRSIVRDLALTVVVVAAMAGAWANRLVPNPDLPLAQALSADMDAAYEAVRSGQMELGEHPQDVAEGVRGARLDRRTGDRWVLAGQAGPDCYALWWDDQGTRRARTVPSTLACEPSVELTSPHPANYDRIGRAVGEGDPRSPWGSILPDAYVLRTWFLPALIIGAGLALSALVRISIALITGNASSATRR